MYVDWNRMVRAGPSRHAEAVEPRWISTGELFYRRGDSVMVSRVTLGQEPSFSEPTFVFSGRYAAAPFEP